MPQTDTAQKSGPGRGSRDEVVPGRHGTPQTDRYRQAHWHVLLVGVIGHAWKRHKRPPNSREGTDPFEEPFPRPSPLGTEPTGIRCLFKHIGPLSQIVRVIRFCLARLIVIVFAAIIVAMTGLLGLPIATTSGEHTDFLDALFTATLAMCVTGLNTVDTAAYWPTFGHVTIILAVTVDGLGVMTLVSLPSLAASRHMRLTQRTLTTSENRSHPGEVGWLLHTVIYTAAGCELLLTPMLLPPSLNHGFDVGHALWYAVFMVLSIFSNAGFIIIPEGLKAYSTDWWIGLLIILGTFMGAVGFPVTLSTMDRRRRPRTWSLRAKLTLTIYLVLTLALTIAIATLEWNNPLTYGPLPMSGKIMTTLVNDISTRSSGLSTIPSEYMHGTVWPPQDALMFVGGGLASTTGGIKVATSAALLLVTPTEARSNQDIEAFGRRIVLPTVRPSMAVAFIGSSIIGLTVLLLLQMTNLPLDRTLFEAVSAFATVGLPMGIAPSLPDEAKYVVATFVFAGRVGIVTVVSALVLRERRRVVRIPEASPMIGQRPPPCSPHLFT